MGNGRLHPSFPNLQVFSSLCCLGPIEPQLTKLVVGQVGTPPLFPLDQAEQSGGGIKQMQVNLHFKAQYVVIVEVPNFVSDVIGESCLWRVMVGTCRAAPECVAFSVETGISVPGAWSRFVLLLTLHVHVQEQAASQSMFFSKVL